MNALKFKIIAHELGNRITALSTRIQLLLMTDLVDPKDAAIINKSLFDMIDTFRRLAELGSNDTSKTFGLDREALSKVLTDTMEQADIRYQASYSFKTDFHVVCGDYLHNVVEELVRNARKAGANSMTVHMSEHENIVRIYFRDNGPGMTAEEREVMHLGHAGARGHGGEGARLIEQMVETFGGAVLWYTGEGVGTTVKLVLRKETR